VAASQRLYVQGRADGAEGWRQIPDVVQKLHTGKAHSFGGEYLELVPHELIRYTDQFDDPNLPGIIHVTVSLRPVSVGTEINIEQAGLPAAIPVEACYLGWQQSLSQLAQLVEPDIPG
jgi:uncharacterized protein YndB with AHSA1/START domain